MPSFSSERITIAVVTAEHHCKVFQLSFHKRDGSLFVSFPYFRDAHGVLCHATLRGGISHPVNVDLTEGGKCTSHRVKYSHHPDGTAHFSQDGRIYSKVRRKSVPLIAATGHLFTVQLQGLDDFEAIPPTEERSTPTANKVRINFKFEGPPPEAIKFVGRWHGESDLLARARGNLEGPWYTLQRSGGNHVRGAVIRDRFLSHDEPCYLLLSCEGIPRLDKEKYAALTFLGGFDPPAIALNHSLDTSFLALSYPTSSYDKLINTIGTVDYVSRNQ